ncbi:MAG: putative transport system permease protein [Microbacteriaceae bacterium]|jgi:putative ABC transport system permease protein|nr:Macrolide export ATP-binding/permease protein macB [Microbacteriaceae bacterium]MDQ1527807.1 putative transport system permease protein [Microbacteriaceae bacterium]MDQ1554569.1 putative transport system permease protein [Microbacteriaceae bacterium]
MSMVEILRSAMRGVLSNKLRSILTMLGVMIGVASVILLLAVGNGSAQQVNAAITQLGTNTLTVRPTSTGGGGASTTGTSTSSSQKVITRDVATELASAGLGHVAQVIPQVSTSLTVASSTISETSINVVGTTPQYFTDTTAKIGSGAAFTAADVTSAAKVAVIGQTIATALFPGQSPIGQTISVSGTTFTVTGVLAQQSSTGFQDPNSVVVAPISRVQQSFTGFGAVSTLTVAATNSSSVSAAQGEIEIELNQLLGITDPTTETYTITNQSTLLATQASSAASFTVLLGAVAAISLLVGGIGVTNVMLVTVTERTREIGIRKALGAAKGAILGQFLAEAATLTLVGGLLGVIAAIIGAQFKINGTTPIILGFSIPLALGVSVAIGVFFGVYPAGRAANMRPIQALRAV